MGALLSLAFAVGSATASAQTIAPTGRHAHIAPIAGVVTAVGTGSLQVKTASATVNVAFTASTRVIKIVSGTTADLQPNARVQLQLASGTTTVNAVEVEQALSRPAGTKPAHTKPAGSTTAAPKTHPARSKPTSSAQPGTGKTHAGAGLHTRAGGQIVSFSGSTLSVKERGGQTVSYTLASNVKIMKVTAGSISDLATGETVRVIAPSNGTAWVITILGS